jgi:uncharacterized protein (TIGR04141 family)
MDILHTSILKNNVEDIFNVSSSFILLCKHNLNVYAIAGGYGYIQLNGIIDDAFGRNVALRMIKNKEVSGLMTFDERDSPPNISCG